MKGFPEVPQGVPPDDLHQTANALHSAALRLLRRARAADTVMDLDGARASLLSVLVFAGPQTVGRLAAIEQVSAPAITRTVDALVSAGLAERVTDPADRRQVIVSATEAGTALLEQGRAARVRLVAGLLDGLPAKDQATLLRAAAILGGLLSPPDARQAGG